MRQFALFVLLLISVSLTGCGSDGKKDPYSSKSAQQIYLTAQEALHRGDYENAIKAFQGLESHYPFGDYTQQGQLDVIYAHLMYEQHPTALFAADRFIRLHPRFPQLDYVYYMKGVIKFRENSTFVERLLPLDPRRREVSAEREAFALFTDFLRRYPESEYAADARLRMVYLRNSLAQHELYAAQYLMTRKAYLAAANRALTVIKVYAHADSQPEALALLVSAYQQLGLHSLAADAQAVLTLNYS